MSSSVSSILSKVKNYGNCGANFIFGTGSDVIGQSVRSAVKNRKTSGQSFGRAVFNGFTDGVKTSNKQTAQTGFVKQVKNAFSSLPNEMKDGWNNAKTAGKSGIGKYFSKIGGFLKPISKVMPFAFNALMALSFVPSIMERAQDEGISGGIKETCKSIGKMSMYALGSAVGAAFGGIGAIAGFSAATIAADSILGKDYLTEKNEKEEKMSTCLSQSEQNDIIQPYKLNYMV